MKANPYRDNAPGLSGPPDDYYGLHLQPFLDRLTSSLSFQAEAISNHAEEAIAAFHSSNPRAAMESIVLRYANEGLDRCTAQAGGLRAMAERCDNYCHLFEADDRMARRAA